VKGLTRKGLAHFYLKEYNKSLEAYDEAMKIDPQNAEAIEGARRTITALNGLQHQGKPDEETIKRAMADPEIQAIMTDPIMAQILQDMQADPKAAQEHLKNPLIMKKIQKLAAAGILQIR